MSGVLWRGFERSPDDIGDLRVQNCPWPPRAIFVRQPLGPVLGKSATPFSHRVLAMAKPKRHLLAAQAFGTE